VKSLVAAVVVALVVSILLTPYGSRCSPGGGWAPEILDDGPEGYLGKRDVPTSGGAAIIVAMWRATVVAMRKCLSGRLHAPL